MDKAIPLVATRDIGTAAARLLAEGAGGKRVIELAGPREYTPRDVAAAVGRIVGKPIEVQQAPEEAMAPALMGAGMNAEWARLFQELTHGLNTGIVVWEGGHPLWRGDTDVQSVGLSSSAPRHFPMSVERTDWTSVSPRQSGWPPSQTTIPVFRPWVSSWKSRAHSSFIPAPVRAGAIAS